MAVTDEGPHPAYAEPAQADWSTLMRCAQEGDHKAYRELLVSITPYIRSIIYRHDYRREDAEDLLQEILLTVHAIRHTFDPKYPFSPWLLTIAHRRIVDRQRQRSRRAARETALTPTHDTFPVTETNGHERDDASRRLRAAVATLPTGQRRAVELLKLRELSLKEASAVSGQSVGALKMATHRAMKTLGRLLGREGDKP